MGSNPLTFCVLFLYCIVLQLQLNCVEIRAIAVTKYYGGYRADVYLIEPERDDDVEVQKQPVYQYQPYSRRIPSSNEFLKRNNGGSSFDSETIHFVAKSPQRPRTYHRRPLPTRVANTPSPVDFWREYDQNPEDGKDFELQPTSNFVAEKSERLSDRLGFGSSSSSTLKKDIEKAEDNADNADENELKGFQKWLATAPVPTEKPERITSNNSNDKKGPDSIEDQSLTQVFNEKKCAEGHKRVGGSRECKPKVNV